MGEMNYNLEKFNIAVIKKKATWWQMELPSGNVFFGTAKSDMLGFPESKFKHYTDFTKLLHKEDYEPTMNAMRDYLENKKKYYETVYRIKNHNGKYIKFYDFGKIIKKLGENITLMGFVLKVEDDENIKEKINDFKEMISSGNPSVIDLVKQIK